MNNLQKWAIRQAFGKTRGNLILWLLDAINSHDHKGIFAALEGLGVKMWVKM